MRNKWRQHGVGWEGGRSQIRDLVVTLLNLGLIKRGTGSHQKILSKRRTEYNYGISSFSELG